MARDQKAKGLSVSHNSQWNLREGLDAIRLGRSMET